METNDYYESLVKQLGVDKDASFEPCKVLEFDPKTLQAKVLGMRTKETKENVIVMFPSFYLSTGIISFPVPGSFGTVLVGPENTNYMLPAQYYLPTKKSINNLAITDASPGQFDFLLKLENLEPGEHLLRSLNHAQIFLSNSGEIELLTKKLNRLSLNDIDGSLETVVERQRKFMGYSNWYSGPHETDEEKTLYEHHMHSEVYDNIPNWEQEEVTLHDAKRLNVENVNMKDELQTPTKDAPKLVEQKVNVYGKNPSGDFSTRKITSDVDDNALFHLKHLFGTASGERERNKHLRWLFEQSQEGAIKIKRHIDELEEGYEFKIDYDRVDFLLGDQYTKFESKLTKNNFASIFKSGGLNLNIDAAAGYFKADASLGGALPRSYIMVTPNMGELAHITPAGKKIAVTVGSSAGAGFRAASSLTSKKAVAQSSGFKINFGEANFILEEDVIGMENNGSNIMVFKDRVVIEKPSGGKIEVVDDDVICNGKSFNKLIELVNKLASIHGLEGII